MNAAARPAPKASRRPRLLLLHTSLFALVALLLPQLTQVLGGMCWESMERNGKCKELMIAKVSREECCSSSQPMAAAWSPEDLDSGAIFFYRVLGDGVSCMSCRESCAGMQCGAGRRCAVRRGRPRCVCAPRCGGSASGGARPGPVCGTDGRSYRTLCRLRKRACRRRSTDLTLDYYGHCQSSCANVRCGAGRHCLVDQDERAHCVRCARSCPRATTALDAQHETRALCGADGRTYPSACHLRLAACRAGRSIPLAYRGPCNPGASCGSVRCKPRQKCLTEASTGAPRCVTCESRCPRAPRPRRALCATDNRTYASWCHMLRHACSTGTVIDTKHAGTCAVTDLDEQNIISDDIQHEIKDDSESDVST